MSNMEERSGDRNNIRFEAEVPDRIVGALMRGARDRNSDMNKLRRACHPANIWIPFRNTDAIIYRNTDIMRRVIVTGDKLDIVNRARIILYKHIRNEIGADILQMLPLAEEQSTLEGPWLEMYELKSSSKSESQPKRNTKRVADAERCRSPIRKLSAVPSSQPVGSSLAKSIGNKKEKTDINSQHILVTPLPWPRKANRAQEHPHRQRSSAAAEGSLIVVSAVGTCDDDDS